MDVEHWNRMHAAWSKLRAPPRVPIAVLASFKELIEPVKGRTLMLGATAGFSELGLDLTAIDHSEASIRALGPGDTPAAWALVGDWLNLPFFRVRMQRALVMVFSIR